MIDDKPTLSPALAADWDDKLESSRNHPLPPPPDGGSDPGLADVLLRGDVQNEAPAWEQLRVAPALRRAVDPHELGVRELSTAYREGRVSPSEIVFGLQERMGTSLPNSEGVLLVMDVTEDVRDSERRLSNGTARPLEGIPFGVKDIIDVAGTLVTSGSRLTNDRVATADATVVHRLRAAGAIPFAMTATTEFALGTPDNPRYGRVRNPWNTERYSGGSSMGSTAAVAARQMPIALGSDTGGSIRQPASWCGVTGLKPTHGMIPRTGVTSLSWTLDHVGFLGRSAEDLAFTLLHTAGPDGIDPLTVTGLEPAAPRSNLAGLRIGVLGGWFTEISAPEVLTAYQSMQDVLSAGGAELVPVDLGDLTLTHNEAFTLLYCEAASLHEANEPRIGMMDPGTAERYLRGRQATAADYLRALRRRHDVQLDVLRAMADVDLLMSPGMARGAAGFEATHELIFGSDTAVHGVHARNTMIFNYVGFPAVMMPAGLTSERMPIGVQLIGRPRHDLMCLQVGAAFQAVTDHHLLHPVHDRRDGRPTQAATSS